jgi:hypothetical protein
MQLKYKSNFLLASGVFLLTLAYVLIYYFEIRAIDHSTDSFGSSLWSRLFLFPVIVAPLLEEVWYRGFLSSKKIVRGLFIILMVVGLFLRDFTWYFLLFSILLLVLYFLNKKYLNPILVYVMIFLSTIYFSLSHFPVGFDLTFRLVPVMMVSFSIGLVLSWIIINFSLRRAVLLHAFWNFSWGLFSFFVLQFVDPQVYTYEDDSFRIEWNQVPVSDKRGGFFEHLDHSISVTNLEIDALLFLLQNDSYVGTLPYMKYDILLEKLSEQPLTKEEFLSTLEQQGIILKKQP